MLLPLLYIEPYVVQKTQNTWTGVFLHGVINGPSFIAIALGIIDIIQLQKVTKTILVKKDAGRYAMLP